MPSTTCCRRRDATCIAAAASLASGLPFLIVRKAAKDYGTANRVEGVYEAGESVCLVEDVEGVWVLERFSIGLA